MKHISIIENRGCDARLDALQAEFGAVLAQRIIDSEAVDFLWEARICERYLGQHIAIDPCSDEAAEELSRVAIVSFLAGQFYRACCLVDGEGRAIELLWKRPLDTREIIGAVE